MGYLMKDKAIIGLALIVYLCALTFCGDPDKHEGVIKGINSVESAHG